MNMRDNSTLKSTLLPALVAVIVLCLAGAAVLTLLTHGASPTTAPATEASLILQRMPFEAQNALRGEATAFDALAKSVARLNGLRSALTDDKTTDPAWNKLIDAASKVGEARKAVETIQTANQEVRELAPKLLSELGDLASAVGVQKLEGMSRYLERFELTVQRVQQELNGLSTGVSDAAPAAQRLADSLEFLNQVMRGLSGEDSGLALSRVTGTDAEQRLKIVVQRNQQFAAAVRKAIGAAEPLSRAQIAARTLPSLTGGLASAIGETAAARDAGGSSKSLVLILLVLAAGLLGALAWVFLKSLNARKTTELRVRENERNQEAIMRLLDELSSLADGDLT